MKILKLKNTNHKQIITETCKVLQAGGLVIYPTETVYGIGVDATNPTAIKKLLQYKSRREGKPLSIAVADTDMAHKFVKLSPQAQDLHKRFLPGPYTIVSKGKQMVAPHVESEFGTLGIRIPDYQLILDLVKKFNKPITATSANASGKKRPYTVQDIFDRLSKKQKNLVDLVIDNGKLPNNDPSTVIDTTLTTPLTVRGNFDQQTPTQIFSTNSDQETKDLAGKLILKNWEKIKKTGIIIGLNGELGTGKTVFTKGIAKFLQISEQLSSPTYTYMNQYDFNRHGVIGTLNHLDVWKIDSKESFDLLEITQLIKPGTVTVIEWWQQIAEYWPNSLTVTFQATLTEPNNPSANNPDHREITIFEKTEN